MLQQTRRAVTSLRFGLRPPVLLRMTAGARARAFGPPALLGRGIYVYVSAFGSIVQLAGPVADLLGQPLFYDFQIIWPVPKKIGSRPLFI